MKITVPAADQAATEPWRDPSQPVADRSPTC
jgi:hypothetical protein